MIDHPSRLDGARVLVTGGAGFIGTALRRTLAAVGARTTALDNLSAYGPGTLALLGTGPHDPQLTVGDVCDESLVRAMVAEADYVVHAAAHSTVGGCAADPTTAFNANLAGTDVVLRAVAEAPGIRRFVLLSTAQVYGNGDPHASSDQVRVFTEGDPVRPLNLYASAKTWAEWHTRQLLTPAERDFCILRPFSVYGPGQVPKPAAPSWVVAQFAMYAALGHQLPLNDGGRQVRDFLYLDDAADAVVHALTAPAAAGRTLNLGTGRATAIRTVADHVIARFPGTTVIDTPRPPGDPAGGCAETSTMRAVLGWSPQVQVAEGIARYAHWVRATPAAIPPWLRGETTASRIEAWNPRPNAPRPTPTTLEKENRT